MSDDALQLGKTGRLKDIPMSEGGRDGDRKGDINDNNVKLTEQFSSI
jgi:hypothetical protein